MNLSATVIGHMVTRGGMVRVTVKIKSETFSIPGEVEFEVTNKRAQEMYPLLREWILVPADQWHNQPARELPPSKPDRE